MDPTLPSVESILAEAVEIASPGERQAFLERACAGSPELRRRVERLVANHFRAGDFLEHPAAELTVDGGAREPDLLGTYVGPFKLRERLGEGGMGVVYLAEQTEPVRRKVALKLIKPGMDSREVVARFEAERQALALMDHPNIAKVLDAGTTTDGRPYFVMELVRGVPITKYCDQTRSGPQERLGLFVSVCQAVQHAHQKGVIHRDLKPSNVLVTLHDGTPVPKVIDFGVAKAVEQRLTDKTIYTRFAQMVGTPLYMSPEQAELSGLDIDTRSDVYALGVLLYELLTGTTPFDRDTFRQASFDEMRRIIREEEPARPSQRVSTLGAEALSTISERRGVDGRRLSQLLRGELDWIVLKAMEKDRNRRYESASAFAADVRRYLDDEPVEASPPSTGYRLRKFARRYRRVLGTAAAIAVALMVATTVSIWLAVRANQAAQAEAQQRALAEDRTRLAREVIQDFYRRVASEWLRDEPQLEGVQREFLEKALHFSRQLADERPTDAQARLDHADMLRLLARVESYLGQHGEAEQRYRRAIALYEGLATDDGDPAAVAYGLGLARTELAWVRTSQHAYPEAERLATQALADAEARLLLLEDNDPERRTQALEVIEVSMDLLGLVQRQTGRTDEAGQTRERQVETYRKLLKERPENDNSLHMLGRSLHNLALIRQAQHRWDEAVQLLEEAVRAQARALEQKPRHRLRREHLANHYHSLANNYTDRQQLGPAEKGFREAVRQRERLVEDFPKKVPYRMQLAHSYNGLANTLKTLKRWDDGESVYQKAVVLLERALLEEPDSVECRKALGVILNNLGAGQQSAGRYTEAETTLRRGEEVLRELAARAPTLENRQHWATTLGSLGSFLRSRRRPEEAVGVLRRCLDVRRKLAEEQPRNLDFQSDLGGARHNLASCLDDLGEHAEAIDLLRNALAVQQPAFDARPKHPRFRLFLRNHHATLAGCLAGSPDPGLRQPHEAIQHALKAIELLPEDSYNGWHHLGVAHYRAGAAAAAISALEEAAKRDKGDPPVACRREYYLSLAYSQAGRAGQAKACFERAEKLWETVQKADQTPSPSLRQVRAEAAALFLPAPSAPKDATR